MCGHVPCRPLFTSRRRNALNSVNPNSFAEAGCLSPPHGPGPTSAGPGELIIDAHQLDSGRRQGPECRVHQALLGWQRMGRGSPRSSEHGPWLLSLAPPSGPISLCPGGCPRPWTQRSQHSLCVPEEGQRQSPLWCPSGSAVTCLAPQLPSCSSSGGQTDQISCLFLLHPLGLNPRLPEAFPKWGKVGSHSGDADGRLGSHKGLGLSSWFLPEAEPSARSQEALPHSQWTRSPTRWLGRELPPPR